MNTEYNHAAPPRLRWGLDRGLLLLVGGALVLIVLGLIAIPLATRRAPTLAPAGTPEGAVQRFYQAAYARDWATAYSFLSADARAQLSLAGLQQQLSGELQDSRAQVSATTITADSATVDVTLSYFRPDGLFGSSEWNTTRQVLLQREGDSWKISSGAFYLPERLR